MCNYEVPLHCSQFNFLPLFAIWPQVTISHRIRCTSSDMYFNFCTVFVFCHKSEIPNSDYRAISSMCHHEQLYPGKISRTYPNHPPLPLCVQKAKCICPNFKKNLSKLQNVFVVFGRKIFHVCVSMSGYIQANQVQISKAPPRVCGQLNWLHLYSSSFLQGHICISPHRLICISFKAASVFLHTG